MRLFKDPVIFHHFVKTQALEYFSFSKNYENLFLLWIENPDLRFGQLLINEGIITDAECWNTEEDKWLVKYGYIEPEDIYLWGTYGVDGQERFDEWVKEKPVFGEPLEKIESYIFPQLINAPDHEIYAVRREKWMKRKPEPIYKFISELDSDHIKKILEIEKVAHRDVFAKVLKNREKS